MAVGLVAASTQRLLLAAPVTVALPFTVGAWFKPRGSGNREIWSMANSGDNANYRITVIDASNAIEASCNSGVGSSTITLNTVWTDNAWSYIVFRGVTATNRRCAVLATTTGAITHGQNTVSRVPAAIVQMAIGHRCIPTPSGYFEGSIAEWFYADADVQADNGQIDNALLHQLAYLGPFSVPHLVPNIVEYRSLRGVSFDSPNDVAGEVYQRGARRDWTLNAAASTADHPPLYSGYVRPNQNKLLLTI